MSLISTDVKPFKATAYKNGKFIDITEADLLGQWSAVFFYPADFTFVCPTELEDLADHYSEFRRLGVEIYSVSTDTHFCQRRGMTPPRPSARSNTPWSVIRPARSAATSK
jgi:alkyl hydroperoxide reductase subunit AhpC